MTNRSIDLKMKSRPQGTPLTSTTPLMRSKVRVEKAVDYGPFYIKTSENESDQYEQKLRVQKAWEEKMHLVRLQREEEKKLSDERREENREKMLADKSNRLIANYTHEGVLSTLHPVKTDKLPPYCSQVNFAVQSVKEPVSTAKTKPVARKSAFMKQVSRR